MLGGRSKATGAGLGQTHPRAHKSHRGCWELLSAPRGGDTRPTTLSSCWGDLKFPRINAGTREQDRLWREYSLHLSHILAKATQLGAGKQTPRFPLPLGPQRGEARGRGCPTCSESDL